MFKMCLTTKKKRVCLDARFPVLAEKILMSSKFWNIILRRKEVCLYYVNIHKTIVWKKMIAFMLLSCSGDFLNISAYRATRERTPNPRHYHANIHNHIHTNPASNCQQGFGCSGLSTVTATSKYCPAHQYHYHHFFSHGHITLKATWIISQMLSPFPKIREGFRSGTANGVVYLCRPKF